LTRKGRVWICCTCDFGDEEDGRNRYQRCSACSHEICSGCKAWKKHIEPRPAEAIEETEDDEEENAGDLGSANSEGLNIETEDDSDEEDSEAYDNANSQEEDSIWQPESDDSE
jgi:hypothetical protein